MYDIDWSLKIPTGVAVPDIFAKPLYSSQILVWITLPGDVLLEEDRRTKIRIEPIKKNRGRLLRKVHPRFTY